MATQKAGFSVIEIFIVVVVVGLLGYLGYYYYNSQIKDGGSSAIEQNPVASDVVGAPEVKVVKDLNEAEKILDATDLNSTTDTTQLDSELSKF